MIHTENVNCRKTEIFVEIWVRHLSGFSFHHQVPTLYSYGKTDSGKNNKYIKQLSVEYLFLSTGKRTPIRSIQSHNYIKIQIPIYNNVKYTENSNVKLFLSARHTKGVQIKHYYVACKNQDDLSFQVIQFNSVQQKPRQITSLSNYTVNSSTLLYMQ